MSAEKYISSLNECMHEISSESSWGSNIYVAVWYLCVKRTVVTAEADCKLKECPPLGSISSPWKTWPGSMKSWNSWTSKGPQLLRDFLTFYIVSLYRYNRISSINAISTQFLWGWMKMNTAGQISGCIIFAFVALKNSMLWGRLEVS